MTTNSPQRKLLALPAALLLIMVVLAGCISSSPPDSIDFRRIESVSDLEGTYRNLSEGGSGESYLSAIIWPNEALDHRAIVAIDVVASGRDALTVRALGTDGTKKEAVFVEGRDFQLESGRIRLHSAAGMVGFKSGEPMLGSWYETVELGLDQKGRGKYADHYSAAGLVYLFLPVAISRTYEVRFVRIKGGGDR